MASSDDKSQDPTPTLKGLRDQMGERSKPAIAIQQKKHQVRAHTPKDNACVHGKPSVSATIAVTLIIIPVIKDLGAEAISERRKCSCGGPGAKKPSGWGQITKAWMFTKSI